jgi:hypothetical protein
MISPRQAAEHILLAFNEISARPGHVLKHGHFLPRFSPDFPADSFRSGVDFAIAHGWIKANTMGDYSLTIEGFSAACALSSIRPSTSSQ